MVGSGPFRFKADERVPGARAVYERFDDYVPRQGGTPDWHRRAQGRLSRPGGVDHDPRPGDRGRGAAGRRDGLVGVRQRRPGAAAAPQRRIKVAVQDPAGQMALLRMNQLQPPFDNPAIRRVVLHAVVQADFLQRGDGRRPMRCGTTARRVHARHAAGQRRRPGRDHGPRDWDRPKRDLTAAGYKGETVALIVADRLPEPEGAGGRGRRHAAAHRHERRLPGDGLGHVLTRRAKQGPGRAGRLEPVLHVRRGPTR